MIRVLEIIQIQLLVSVRDTGLAEKFLPSLFGIGFGVKDGLLLADLANCQLNLYDRFSNEALLDMIYRGEASVVVFLHPFNT